MKMKKLLYIGLGLFLMSCLPQNNNDEGCEGEGRYFDQSTKECVKVISTSQKTSLREEVQAASDYGCVAKSNGLYCWGGKGEPKEVLPNLIEGVKKYQMVTYKDLNISKTQGAEPSGDFAFLMILTSDNKLIVDATRPGSYKWITQYVDQSGCEGLGGEWNSHLQQCEREETAYGKEQCEEAEGHTWDAVSNVCKKGGGSEVSEELACERAEGYTWETDKCIKDDTKGINISLNDACDKVSGYTWETDKCVKDGTNPKEILTHESACGELGEGYLWEDSNCVKEPETASHESVCGRLDGYSWNEDKCVATFSPITSLAERLVALDVEDFKIHGATICAHMVNKSIKCFGDNRKGQLGLDVLIPKKELDPTALSSDENYINLGDLPEMIFLSGDEHAVLGSRKDVRKFNSFKMFGEKNPSGGYDTGICGLNVRGHIYCWGHVEEGKDTIDIKEHSREVDRTYRVKLIDGEVETDFIATDYVVSPKGHVMYAKGRKGDEDSRNWYAFGYGDGDGLGTEGIGEFPIRMLDSEGEEEDTSNIREIFVTNGDTQCLLTDEDLLRCAFDGRGLSGFGKGDESQFVAFGNKKDKITDFYVFGKDGDYFCFILEKGSELQCNFNIEFENRSGVVEFKSHGETFCILNEKDELHCQKGSEYASIEGIDMRAFYIGGEGKSEFVLAHAKDGRFYGWGEDDDSDKHPAFNGSYGGEDDGFGDINKKDDSDTDEKDDDDLDELGFLYLDQVFTGHHNHVVGRSGMLYYRWGKIGSQNVTVEATKGHGGDGEELEF